MPRERAGDVAPPLDAVQPDLGRGVADPDEPSPAWASEGVPGPQLPHQELGLVVATVAGAAGVERHGDGEHGGATRTGRLDLGTQEAGQGGGERLPPLVLEPVDHSLQGTLVRDRGPERGEGPQASPAEAALARGLQLPTTPGAAGIAEGTHGAGAVLAATVSAVLVGRRLGGPILAAALAFSGALAAVAFGPGLAGTVALLTVAGAGHCLLGVAIRTLLQRSVPPRLIGRIFGVLEGFTMAGLALGALLVPALARSPCCGSSRARRP